MDSKNIIKKYEYLFHNTKMISKFKHHEIYFDKDEVKHLKIYTHYEIYNLYFEINIDNKLYFLKSNIKIYFNNNKTYIKLILLDEDLNNITISKKLRKEIFSLINNFIQKEIDYYKKNMLSDSIDYSDYSCYRYHNKNYNSIFLKDYNKNDSKGI